MKSRKSAELKEKNQATAAALMNGSFPTSISQSPSRQSREYKARSLATTSIESEYDSNTSPVIQLTDDLILDEFGLGHNLLSSANDPTLLKLDGIIEYLRHKGRPLSLKATIATELSKW
jgi:hypothetical protein